MNYKYFFMRTNRYRVLFCFYLKKKTHKMLPEVPEYAEMRNKYNMVTSFYHYNVVTARRAAVRFLSFQLIGTGYVR